jgi:peptidoglycan-associated lipoprotein
MTVSNRMVGPAALALVLSVGIAACSKKTPAIAPPPPESTYPAAPATPPPPPPAPAPPPAPTAAPLTEEQIFAQKSLDQLNSERPLGDVFFSLDQASIRDEARASLQKNAEWMKRWTATRITVEGHCDERGTPEYNLALGERRANAVREYLESLGIARDRVSVVSKGKEAPFCNESNESCWQQNRRGHFVITAK